MDCKSPEMGILGGIFIIREKGLPTHGSESLFVDDVVRSESYSYRLKASFYIQLLENVFHMGLYGVQRDEQFFGNLLVTQSLGQKRKNFTLPSRQAVGLGRPAQCWWSLGPQWHHITDDAEGTSPSASQATETIPFPYIMVPQDQGMIKVLSEDWTSRSAASCRNTWAISPSGYDTECSRMMSRSKTPLCTAR